MFANYGSKPINPELQIREKFSKILKDPASAKFRMSETFRAYIKAGLGLGNENVFGWGITVGVNTKNGFGGYTGERLYRCLFYTLLLQFQICCQTSRRFLQNDSLHN